MNLSSMLKKENVSIGKNYMEVLRAQGLSEADFIVKENGQVLLDLQKVQQHFVLHKNCKR